MKPERLDNTYIGNTEIPNNDIKKGLSEPFEETDNIQIDNGHILRERFFHREQFRQAHEADTIEKWPELY